MTGLIGIDSATTLRMQVAQGGEVVAKAHTTTTPYIRGWWGGGGRLSAATSLSQLFWAKTEVA